MTEIRNHRHLPDSVEFRRWLDARAWRSRRVVSDTVSRARRVWRAVDILSPESEAELVFRLTQWSDFGACTPTVRSQLKRAARLYREFVRDERERRACGAEGRE